MGGPILCTLCFNNSNSINNRTDEKKKSAHRHCPACATAMAASRSPPHSSQRSIDSDSVPPSSPNFPPDNFCDAKGASVVLLQQPSPQEQPPSLPTTEDDFAPVPGTEKAPAWLPPARTPTARCALRIFGLAPRPRHRAAPARNPDTAHSRSTPAAAAPCPVSSIRDRAAVACPNLRGARWQGKLGYYHREGLAGFRDPPGLAGLPLSQMFFRGLPVPSGEGAVYYRVRDQKFAGNEST